MLRSSFIAASLACLLWSAGVANAAEASAAPDASNIGFVLYTKSLSPGTLNARWLFTHKYRGPGIATGGSQRNVYFSIAVDGALIAKLQDYHIDVVGAAPVFGKTEPWARFPHTKR